MNGMINTLVDYNPLKEGNLIKVLLLEDSELDVELIRAKLKKHFAFIDKVVYDKNSFAEALSKFVPDIILSDYSMPQFNGLEALKILKESGLNRPFIIITGAIDEETAYLMLNLLQGVINEGTGVRLRNRPNYGQFMMPIAGKTGTTQNHSDGWFIGVTPKLSAGVWTGADLRSIHFKTIGSGQGANMALPIWGYFYKKVLADESLGIKEEEMEFKKPLNFNINLDCDEIEQKSAPADFDDFF